VGRPGLEQSRRPVAVLSVPELAVLRLLSDGRTNREIAHRLRYSIGTVKDYVQRILEKLEASNRTEAAVKAVREGVLS
jgi:NarL family two-component system response regulator LiaR